MHIPYIPSTICAIATAPGVGGIAIIRLSGHQALSIADKLFKPMKGEKKLSDYPKRQAIYGTLEHQGKMLDEVIALYYLAPQSYTGEEVVEIQCHGSLYICQSILSALLAEGCTMATPGEFTQRAYLNGKMNLSEAEAVADIIHAETEAQHRLAFSQLRGGYSAELMTLREDLLRLTALMELELDFSEEDVEFADRTQLLGLVETLQTKLRKLTESFRLGNAIKRGIPVAIVGATNVGKSTLLNALLGEERAIVSDIHGTTRDSIEDTMNIGGYLFRFVDTAGIRKTEDSIEAIGIERSLKKMSEASIRLLLIDLSRAISDPSQIEQASQLIADYGDKGLIILLNKSDLVAPEQYAELRATLTHQLGDGFPILGLSAKEQAGIDELKHLLIQTAQLPEHEEGDIVVSNSRHQHLFTESSFALGRVREGLDGGLPTDLLTQDLRLAISHIGEITGGAITSDSVLHHIFAHFCIGK